MNRLDLRWGAALPLLVLPWLNPAAPGPSPAVAPWLFSAACAAAFAALSPSGGVRAAWAWALAALAVWATLRGGMSLDVAGLWGSLALVLAVAAAASGWQREGRVRALVGGAWLAAAVASAVIGLAQYLGWADMLGPLAAASPAGEAYANLRQRNQAASLTVIGTVAALWLLPGARHRAALLAAVALLALGNAATTSRTGLLQLMLVTGLFAIWPHAARRAALAACGLALATYAAGAILLPAVAESLGRPGASLWERVGDVASCSSRGTLWSNIVHLVMQRPWLGWGWGETDYAHYATLYPHERFCDILDNAHSLPLHLAVELGVPAALLVCGALGAWAWRARFWAEASPDRQAAWAVLAVIGAHSLLEYPLWYGPFQIAAGLCLGLLWAPRPDDGAASAPPAPRARWALPALLAVAVGYASWDYWRVSQVYLAEEDRAAVWRDDVLTHIRRSQLYASQAAFAELSITPLARDNAQWSLDTAERLLHYSPEPMVIERVVEAATMLDRPDLAVWHLARLRAAFPDAYADWSRRLREPASSAR